jgi:hypothetical protein
LRRVVSVRAIGHECTQAVIFAGFFTGD